MSAADVDLCNEALRLLGEARIATFEEGTDLASTCDALYRTTIQDLIARHPWRFSLRKLRLAQETAAPDTQWRYAHVIPGECLVLRTIYASSAVGAPPVMDFDRQDGRVLSNCPDLWADYQVATDPTAWPPAFRALARYALAADFAVPVSGSMTAADLYFRRAFGGPAEGGNGGQLGVARMLEAQQQGSTALRDFPLIAARYGAWR